METKFKKSTIATATLAAAGVLMLSAPSDVLAGFEWRSSPAAPALTTADILRNAQTPATQTSPMHAAPSAMPAPVTPVTAMPVAPPPAAVAAPRSQPAPVLPAPTPASTDVIGGFGNDLPMVIALQQVVPAGYQFSFAPNVNPGATVSWQGGKPWQQVLSQMLAPLQVGYSISGNVVNIGDNMAPPAPVAPVVAQNTAPVVAELPPAISLTDVVDQDEPPVMRRTGRRGAVATRRDVDPNRRSWFGRLKDSFSARPQKKENEKASPDDAPVSVLATGDIEWKPTDTAQKMEAPVTATPAPATASQSAAVETAILPPVTLSTPVAAQAPVSLTSSTQPPATPDVLNGFGRDLPLSIALMQIIPAGYDTAFAQEVDQALIVSWQGGKTWQHVLDETLTPQNLSFIIDGNLVRISPAMAPVALIEQTTETVAIVEKSDAPQIRGRRDSAAPAPSGDGWTTRMKNMFTFGDDKATEQAAAPAPVIAPAPVAAPVATAPDIAPPPVAIALPPTTTPAFATPVAMPPTWTASKGTSLRDALAKWGESANVDLYWSIDYDYILNSDVAYGGNFEQAVGQLLGSMKDSRPQPYGRLHKVANGSDVLVIEVHAIHN